MNKQELVRQLSRRYEQIPGIAVGFSQPILDMVNDKIAGAHSELVIKIFGRDFDEMRRIATEMVEVLKGVPGAADVSIDQEPPLPQLQIQVNREAAARFGVNVADIASLIEIGVGGRPVGQMFQNERRYDITARFVESARYNENAIGNLTLTAPSGARIPLSQVSTVAFKSGESTITRESNRRHLTVKLNLRGRALTSFLAEARDRFDRAIHYDPQLYQVVWGGQFENQERAQARLAIIVPLALGLIFLLLYGAFKTLRHAAMILASVPLALLGGMVALHLRGMTLNVSSAVGFIALFGVAVQNGVIMISYLNQMRGTNLPLAQVVIKGATDRLRPVLMTATVATLGLLPAALARGIGSDVQRPLATVIVGGLVSATILTLAILPVLYFVVEKRWPDSEMPLTEEPAT
jgi:heavy metal efflux system protein